MALFSWSPCFLKTSFSGIGRFLVLRTRFSHPRVRRRVLLDHFGGPLWVLLRVPVVVDKLPDACECSLPDACESSACQRSSNLGCVLADCDHPFHDRETSHASHSFGSSPYRCRPCCAYRPLASAPIYSWSFGLWFTFILVLFIIYSLYIGGAILLIVASLRAACRSQLLWRHRLAWWPPRLGCLCLRTIVVYRRLVGSLHPGFARLDEG